MTDPQDVGDSFTSLSPRPLPPPATLSAPWSLSGSGLYQLTNRHLYLSSPKPSVTPTGLREESKLQSPNLPPFPWPRRICCSRLELVCNSSTPCSACLSVLPGHLSMGLVPSHTYHCFLSPVEILPLPARLVWLSWPAFHWSPTPDECVPGAERSVWVISGAPPRSA